MLEVFPLKYLFYIHTHYCITPIKHEVTVKIIFFFALTDSLPIETHVPVITIIIQQKLDLKQRYNLKHTRCTKQKNNTCTLNYQNAHIYIYIYIYKNVGHLQVDCTRHTRCE